MSSAAGDLIAQFSTTAKDFYELNKKVKEQLENWRKNPEHPERANYNPHVMNGSRTQLAEFVLEHKDENYRRAVADVWDIDVKVETRGHNQYFVTIRL